MAQSLVQIPPFYCPIEPGFRSDADEIERRSLAWLTTGGAYANEESLTRLAAGRCGISVTPAMPEARPEVVQIAADFTYWGFSFDDAWCDEGPHGRNPEAAVEFLGTLTRITECPGSAVWLGNPWADTLRDLCRRVDCYATPEQYQRWADGLRTYFAGATWESRYGSRGVCPDLDTYLMIRRGSIGMEPLTALNDIGDGYLLPPDTYHAPLVRALRELTWLIVVLDNDIYSHAKETRRRNPFFNCLNVLSTSKNISPQQALPDVVALRDRLMCLFLALRDQASADASPELARYLVSLGLWLRTDIDWAMTSHRYHTTIDTQKNIYTDHPTDDRLEPPPLPSIAWWWTLLTPPPRGPHGRQESGNQPIFTRVQAGRAPIQGV